LRATKFHAVGLKAIDATERRRDVFDVSMSADMLLACVKIPLGFVQQRKGDVAEE
jgi:hypothetical protein